MCRSCKSSHRNRRNLIHGGKTKPVVPIGPGAFTELSSFGMDQYMSQKIIPDVIGKSLNIGIVPDVHDLSNDTLRHADSLIGRFPPYVLACQELQGISVAFTHDIHFGPDLCQGAWIIPPTFR